MYQVWVDEVIEFTVDKDYKVGDYLVSHEYHEYDEIIQALSADAHDDTYSYIMAVPGCSDAEFVDALYASYEVIDA